MATSDKNLRIVPVTDWAVGHARTSRLVALRLNGDAPVVLRVEDAREIAAALKNEADMVDDLPKREKP
jgi:hypothetical protein